MRIFSQEPNEPQYIGHTKLFYEYDPLYGWRRRPNTDRMRVNARKNVLYQINSKGIRGPEYSYEKKSDEFRILVLGDSHADGFSVEFNELFSDILKQTLNSKIRDKYYEVINSGTSGWSTDQELLFFQKEGKKYNPDITILSFCENDVFYNNQPKDWTMYYKPLFKLENGALKLTNVPVPRPDNIIYSNQLEMKNVSFMKTIRIWLHENSYLYAFVKTRIHNSYNLRSIAQHMRLTDGVKDEKIEIPRDFKVWAKTYNEAVRDSWEITEALVLKLKQEADSIGSKLLVFYIPDEASIYQDKWNVTKKKYGLSDDEWDPAKSGIVLGDICRRNNIDFINPTQLFKFKAAELSKRNILLYDQKDGHLSVIGNRYVGELQAEYIYSNYLKNNVNKPDSEK